MDKEEILSRLLSDLSEVYSVGLYEYLYENHRATYDAILRAEDKVNQAFLTGTVEDLKVALRNYWRLHMEAIKQFN